MNRLFTRPVLISILIGLVSALVFHSWIFSWQPVTAGDWHINDKTNLQEYFSPPNIINSSAFTGIDIVGLSFYPFNFFTSVFTSLGFEYSVALRFIFLYPIVFIGPISFYFLIRKTLHSDLGGVLGAFLYLFNPYFMILSNGVLTLMVSCALFPLIFIFYLKAIEKNSIRWLLITGLATYIASYYEVRGVYLMLPILFTYALYHLIIIQKIRTINLIIRKLVIILIPFYLVFLLSLYWIFGLLANHSPALNQAYFHRALFGEGIMSAVASVNQFHPFWAGDHSTNFQVMLVSLRFWLLPLGAFLGFWVNRKNKIVWFFALIAFMGILLSKQGAEPFGGIYKWLFFNIPGFSAFRESSKFYFYTAIGYSFLIASFITYLSRNKKYAGWTLLVVFFSFSYLAYRNAQGQFTGTIRGLSVTRTLPADYQILKNYLLSQPEFFRTLWLPYYSRWIPNYPTHPKLAANALYYSSWNLINPDSPVTARSTEAEKLTDMLSSTSSARLLAISGIKYVVVPLLDQANDDDFFYLFNKPRDYYISAISHLSYLTPIDLPTQEVKVYQTQEIRPLFYLTSQPESINEQTSFTPITYQRLSAYEYIINVPDLSNYSEEIYLNFVTIYDPNWRFVDSHVTWPGIFNATSLLAPSFNEKNVAGFNSFRINSSFSNRTLKLYYFPQAYVFLGWYISLGILLGTIYLIIRPKTLK